MLSQTSAITGFPAGPDAFVAYAPAKVNLFLEVLRKRSDGFHAIETLILAVNLFDTLEVRRSPKFELNLVCDPPELPTGPANLVYKAAEKLRQATGTSQGATMRLVKRIPHAAGLGGGSSDAALTIVALNRVWNLRLPHNRLLEVAAAVGSDVGFFLTPLAAWCTGRGEVIEPEVVGTELHLVIVKPPVGLSTAEVYNRVTVPPHPVSGDAIRKALRSGNPDAIAQNLHNRLQASAFAAEPLVETIHRRLTACGPLGVMVSGSGSSEFAVCRDHADAVRVAGHFDRTTPPSEAPSRTFVVRGLYDSSSLR